ncbi:MAG: motif family protein, partial [Pseudomonadota bacterium]
MLRSVLTLLASLTIGFTAIAAPHGMGGHGGGMGFMLAEKLKTELALNPAQTAEWDKIAASAKAARAQARTLHEELITATKAELANPQPDLAKLAAKKDAIHTQVMALMKPIQTQKLAFYQSLSAEQKTKVR